MSATTKVVKRSKPATPQPVSVGPITGRRRVPVSGVRRVVVLSDLQIPFEDPAALAAAEEVARAVRPDLVVLNGDVVDCYAESDFLKDPIKAAASIPETHRKVRELLGRLSDIAPGVWLGGNHEDRWRKLLFSGSPTALHLVRQHQDAAGVALDLSDPVGSFAALYGMPAYGYRYFPYQHRLYFAEGNLVVTHGQFVSRHAGYSAKRTLEWLGVSCIVGHTHRLGSYLLTQDGVTRGAWEGGCLCDLEPEWVSSPNWQQGFVVISVNGPKFHVVPVPIVRIDGDKPVAVFRGDI